MNIIRIICGFLLSGLFLTLCQWPFEMSAFAWISFLPIVFIATPDSRKRWLIVFGFLTCLLYWLGNLYWLWIPTKLGYFTFCVYMAFSWPLIAVAVRYIRKRGWPITFLLPIIIVGGEAWQGTIMGGFSWRLIGHSMHNHITLIQIADIFGVAGISFVIAVVNGFAAEVLIDKRMKFVALKFIFTAGVVVATIFYGNNKLEDYETTDLPQSPVIAAVQTNEPITIAGIADKADLVFDQMINLSKESLTADPYLIVWPETMVIDTLEHEYLNLRGRGYSGYYYNQSISAFAAENKVQMVIGASGGDTDYDPNKNTVGLRNQTNAAYVYHADGKQDPNRYDKIHLVPFGEIVPFKQSAPIIYDFLMTFTPNPERDYSLTAGEEFFTYSLESGGNQHKYGVIICYEDTMAPLVREMVANKTDGKRVNWLVNISNDGWFTWREKYTKKINDSTELAQHAIIASFRAVENRIGIVRSVNTGVSCFIEPTGRIKDGFIDGTLHHDALRRRAQSGWVADTVSVDDTFTFYSKYGQWLDFVCGILILPIMVLSLRKL